MGRVIGHFMHTRHDFLYPVQHGIQALRQHIEFIISAAHRNPL